MLQQQCEIIVSETDLAAPALTFLSFEVSEARTNRTNGTQLSDTTGWELITGLPRQQEHKMCTSDKRTLFVWMLIDSD